jgi:predicted GNAT family N-acyltransferase
MITNKWILGNGDYSDALKLRHAVFVEEQGVTAEPDPDEMDPLAVHLVIYDADEPVAAGRVYHDGKAFRIGR